MTKYLMDRDVNPCGGEFLASFKDLQIAVEAQSAPLRAITGATKSKAKKEISKKTTDALSISTPAHTFDPKQTLLHLAALHNNVELADLVCYYGETLSERDSAGYSPFHVTLLLGNIDMIKFVIGRQTPTIAALRRSTDPVDASYPLPSDETLLSLAVTSASDIAVRLVTSYSSPSDVESNWIWVAGLINSGLRTDIAPWEAILWELTEVDNIVDIEQEPRPPPEPVHSASTSTKHSPSIQQSLQHSSYPTSRNAIATKATNLGSHKFRFVASFLFLSLSPSAHRFFSLSKLQSTLFHISNNRETNYLLHQNLCRNIFQG